MKWRRGPFALTSAVDRDALLSDAGFRAAASMAATAGVLLALGSAVEQLRSFGPAPPLAEQLPTSTGPVATHQAEPAFGTAALEIGRDLSPLAQSQASAAAWSEAPDAPPVKATPAVLVIETPAAVETAPEQPISFVDNTLNLELGDVSYGYEPLQPSAHDWTARPNLADRLERTALRLLPERVPTSYGARELSLFVASDDEALSWSMSRASPNHGGLAYERDGIDVGDLSAGVALSTADMDVALAYVDPGSHADEDYAGILVTLRGR